MTTRTWLSGATDVTAGGRILARARHVAALLFGPPAERAFAVRYWNALVEPAGANPPAFTLVLRSPGALRRMCMPPSELALGEAFVRGDFDVEGDLEATIAAGEVLAARLASLPALTHITLAAARLPGDHGSVDVPQLAERHGARHSPERDLTAVRAHYDLGNDFYAQWLDESMTYSCAYFKTGTEDLDTAQRQKLDFICRKLRLAPGEKLLDVGSGWGSLVRYASMHYGADAYGITLSEQQAAWAQGNQVTVADYRADHPAAPFDKIVTVGMIEHVGSAKLEVFFRRLYELLKPGGVALVHGITVEPTPRRAHSLWRQGAFIDRHIFPDGELTTLGARVVAAEAVGFEVRDVESLREHYVLTLRHWLRRLERARPIVEPMVGRLTYRAWRLYMAGSAHGFDSGRLGVSQMLCVRRDAHGRAGLPLTRGA